jgi:uncharacterized protein DUF642/PEP-CTERM motif-containing protein
MDPFALFRRRPWLIAAALSCAMGSAQADPVLVDGGFETASIAVGRSFVYLTGTQLTGWTSFSSFGGTVLFNNAYMPVGEGSHAVQIEMPGDSISQTFDTVRGTAYRVSFEMSAYTAYGGPGLGAAPCPCTSILEVSAGSVDALFAASSIGYSFQTFDFEADASFATLTFKNPSLPSAYGNFPHLDDVSIVVLSDRNERISTVTAVPEPETYALMLAGLGAMGFLARSRQRAKNGSVAHSAAATEQ